MRDLPSSRDLLALARELLLDELVPLLPPERARDAHLIATTMAIAAREMAAGQEWLDDLGTILGEFYAGDIPTPTLPRLRGREPRAPTSDTPSSASEGGLGLGAEDLLVRFAADLRNGAFETSPSQEAAVRAILWRLTIDKLREGNPHFLAANGLRAAGGQDK
jgi:hypothetical protein